jgi:hypothetical protein
MFEKSLDEDDELSTLFQLCRGVSFIGGGNWCLTPLSTLFQLCRGG